MSEMREHAMIKVSVMYPNTPGARFDHEYYRDKHMPLVKARMERCLQILYGGQGALPVERPGSRDVCRNVSHLLRLGRGIPGWFWAPRPGDHG